MTFDDVADEGLRAACQLVQEVAAALLAQLSDGQLAGVSKRELARRAGVGQATLWPLLGGTLWPRTDTLLRVAAAAGVRIGVRKPAAAGRRVSARGQDGRARAAPRGQRLLVLAAGRRWAGEPVSRAHGATWQEERTR